MSLFPVDISPADVVGDALRLRLGPNTLSAVASCRVELGSEARGELTAVLEVLTASHRVTLISGGRDLVVETVACDPGASTPAAGVVDAFRLPEEHRWATELGPSCFTSRTLHGQTSLDRARAEIDDLDGRAGSVVVGFPGHADALTAVVADRAGLELRWRTWHLYPGSDPHHVTTTTTLTLQEAS